jgi:hypothetical protein
MEGATALRPTAPSPRCPCTDAAALLHSLRARRAAHLRRPCAARAIAPLPLYGRSGAAALPTSGGLRPYGAPALPAPSPRCPCTDAAALRPYCAPAAARRPYSRRKRCIIRA